MKVEQPTACFQRPHIWRDLASILVLCVLSVALYRKIALTNQVLPGADAMTYFYPYRAYAAETLREGRVPLWNPYLFLGVPFLANPQTAVLYPLNLALVGLSAPKQVAWSLVVHTALAGVFAYLYARRVLSLSSLAACLAAAAFGLGGYLAAQAEHVNQVNVLAWFPLLLLLWHARRRVPWLSLLGMAAVVGLGLLAGHAQASFVTLVGLALYVAISSFLQGLGEGSWSVVVRSLIGALSQLALVVLVAFGLAAVQVLPTLELSRLSLRGGGLDYRQAVAFSLKPLPYLLRYTFLPVLFRSGERLGVLFGGDYYTEYLAYIGSLPFLFALLACVLWGIHSFRFLRSRDGKRVCLSRVVSWLREEKGTLPLLSLAVAGPFLALGLYNPLYWLLFRLVPGFNLFRVPARWLFLYAFGAAMLAGIGLQNVQAWLLNHLRPRHWAASFLPALLTALGLVELLVAAQHLPLHHPTAPESFSSLRTAAAHIRAAQAQEAAPGRFLSMSDTRFDPGDLTDLQQIYQDQLSPQSLYDHIVNTKRQEVLAPNLPLAWRIYAVDGYDGGVLPLARYIHLQRLLLDESSILTDGRIREGLIQIPSTRVLSILGAEYVLTDKVHDVWIDGVFYDLAFEVLLSGEEDAVSQAYSSVQATSGLGLPYHTATTLGIVSHLQDAHHVPQGTPVAYVKVTMRNPHSPGSLEQRTFELLAGRDTAQGLYAQAAHGQAQIGRQWQTGTDASTQVGYDYATRFSWGTPQDVVQVDIQSLPFEGQLLIRGLTLIDERDQSSTPLLLNSRGRFVQVHSGDVKIYRALDSLPRVYVVHQARIPEDDAHAVAVMADPAFDPSQTVLLHPDPRRTGPTPTLTATATPPAGTSQVKILAYNSKEILLQADLAQPGYVVISDTWYPGWQAQLDGHPAAIERANLAFRAIYVPQGLHSLQMTYRPATYAWGQFISLGTLLVALLGIVLSTRQALHTRRTLAQNLN